MRMELEEAKSMFTLAGIPFTTVWKLQNDYWPDHPNYYESIVSSPWWLFKTPKGLIKIGWRKRVISIDWEDTGIKCGDNEITTEDVTKWNFGIHAWSVLDATKYLATFWKIATTVKLD